MNKLESQFICVKDFIADDGIHFKKYNCYIGKTKIFDESLTLQGEQGINVSFYGGNDYLKRLIYKGSIKDDSDGNTPVVRASHVILSSQDEDYALLGVVWSVDDRVIVKLNRKLELEEDYILEVRNTKNNNVEEDKEILKLINDSVKRAIANR